jgi:hypothetical protein
MDWLASVKRDSGESTMSWKPALPCIICNKLLFNVYEDAVNQPSDGLGWVCYGNYGSTVFDPIGTGEYLELNICDECVTTGINQGYILEKKRQ